MSSYNLQLHCIFQPKCILQPRFGFILRYSSKHLCMGVFMILPIWWMYCTPYITWLYFHSTEFVIPNCCTWCRKRFLPTCFRHWDSQNGTQLKNDGNILQPFTEQTLSSIFLLKGGGGDIYPLLQFIHFS